MDWIALIVYVASALGAATLFYFVGARPSRVAYEDDPRIQSKSLFRISWLIAAATGLLLSVLQSFAGLDLLGFTTVALTTVVVFLLSVSAYTDHRYRMMDRVLLRWGLLVAIAIGIFRLIEIQSEPVTVLYAVSILLSFAVMFVPSIGASDSRAFMILFAAGIPMLGVEDTYYVFLLGIALWLIYGLVSAVKNRSFKVSIPLVPYILAPLAVMPVAYTVYYGVGSLIGA